ncbi:MAG: tRNA preQ1(34) S-adenosylmethionine ribosyltransferase-isomerase QueA [Gemmataceae bacterium]|nr:tRNA preQ1(34) S-adenosylmethionine ribosyltransferase-isomerase QueA [Gemmataceae bacterium]MCI0740489.1 tRNA preQ1(34) S-adenosylmethionine ribosyltransferase-isomerase QueA [Gemmataceae bacterium]
MSRFPFDYELPLHLIAQSPCEPRDQARLLVVDRNKQSLHHRRFFELPKLLSPGDLLVLNNTKVLQARLLGKRERTGGKWEGLFLRETANGYWEMLCQTRGQLHPGENIVVETGALKLTLEEKLSGGRWLARPALVAEGRFGNPSYDAVEILERHGHVPLPPYIRKGADRPEDRDRYQTVFAQMPGAVAAPTAGLHFTPRVFDELTECGVNWTFVTLHVGLGTFAPMQSDDPAKHEMHREWGELTEEAAQKIVECKRRGGKVLAVGTTSARVLETAAGGGKMASWRGETNLFILPPFAFRAVDALLTNFHLPKTTLLLLVSAFTGIELLRRVYEAAISDEYRFYSYGDAMLVL